MTDDKTVLPPNHKRILAVSAKHVAQGIEEIRSAITDMKSTKAIPDLIRNLEDRQRDQILTLTEELKSENERLINDLNLQLNRLYEDRFIRSRISHLWVILSDSTAKGLRGYGQLSKNLERIVDSHINRLLEIIQKMQSVLD